MLWLSFCACRQQDEDLDELGASLVRIGDVGLTIHDELLGQVKTLKLAILFDASTINPPTKSYAQLMVHVFSISILMHE